ncbi:MAG: alpha/beta hydrolase, partial [Umezawaea sp.]
MNFADLELEYDTFGDPADPALVLVMGLGAQMTTWDEGFCALFAEQGFHVIRYDNRDVGLSTSLDHLPQPDLAAVFAGDTTTAPYLLADLAADLIGLLDALGIERAHVVGASMGGMIVQQAAIDHPERLLSLCSIMSTTGDPSVGHGKPEVIATLGPPAPPPPQEVNAEGRAAARGAPAPRLAVDEAGAREPRAG